MDNKRPLIAHLCILMACVFWGLMSPIGKIAMQNGIDNIDLVYFRACGGAVLFWLTSLFVKKEHVPFKDISKFMRDAMVAAEDREFYNHNGVDLKGVARAFVNNSQGGQQQGASTLTMQYVRMAQAYGAKTAQEVIDATKDSPKRKINEMKYALQVEKELTKEQILERSLNTAPFGNGAYGVYAGSQVYFKKKPKDLTVPEAALLAGMVKAPTRPTTKPAATDARIPDTPIRSASANDP